MKKIIRTLNVILLLTAIAGCNDFLEEKTRGIIEPGNFYQSDEEAVLAINGIYNRIHGDRERTLYSDWWTIQSWTVYGADDVGPGWPQTLIEFLHNYTMTESNYGNAREVWRQLFAVVSDANSVIASLQGNENISESIRLRVTGEAIFLRSFAYYHLTNIWGAVPYYDQELPISEVSSLGRTDPGIVRSNVIDDLKTIEDNGMLPSEYQGADIGRATVWTAKMLSAKMMMWEKDWVGALEEAKEIIDNSPHSMLDTYDEVFDLNAQNPFHAEVIWGFDFSKDNALTNTNRTDGFNPRIRDEPANPADRNALRAALAARGEEFNGFGLTVCLPGFAADFPLDDLRKPLNVLNEYLGFPLTNTYLPKHWNLDFVNSPRGNHGELYIIFRLADTYLMAAEAANELGDPSAYDYINAVRARAYEPDKPYAGLTQDEFRKALQDERRWELAAEGFRRYDLIRWGILVETVRSIEYPIFDGPANIKDIHVKAPIPQEELLLNPNLLEFDPSNNGYR
jgi:hypothetical protein